MTEVSTRMRDRTAKKVRKREDKKREIADSAIQALKSLGYANTTLRDIALMSDLSLGMLHYYFEDKIELIIFCVRIYKEEFVRTVRERLTSSSSPEEIVSSFSAALATAITRDGDSHRLWYDIRVQAMFDAAFRPVVAEIEAALIDIIRDVADKTGDSGDIYIKYAAIDGLFRYCLQTYADAPEAGEEQWQQICDRFNQLLRRLV